MVRGMAASNTPDVGKKAPAFNLPDQNGNKLRLSSLKGKKVFVYFYPKAMTPGCNTQAQALNEDLGRLKRRKVEVIGISPDAPERLAKFEDKFGLKFHLLSDESTEIAQKYGVWVQKKNFGKEYMGVQRSAFLVDADGKIAAAWPKISPKSTVDELDAALDDLKKR